MLVLNRRPGESIIIEPGITVTVLSVAERRVWISTELPGLPPLRLSATPLAGTDGRVEIGPLAGVHYDGPSITVTLGDHLHPGAAPEATFAVNRRCGERVHLGPDAWVALASLSKGNPCVEFGGPLVGGAFRITLIRPAGAYVRLGVDAPERRVFREELWEAVQAGPGGDRWPPARHGDGGDAANGGDGVNGGDGANGGDDPGPGTVVRLAPAVGAASPTDPRGAAQPSGIGSGGAVS